MAKQQSTTKRNTPKTSSSKKKSTPSKTESTSLKQRINKLRSDRNERKAEQKRHKQTEKARQEKAKQEAIRDNAVKQVNDAVEKSKRRKSRPLLTLIFALILAGLGAGAMYQYRQLDVDDRDAQVAELEAEIQSFYDEKQALEAQKRAEEARFTSVEIGDASLQRVPRAWTVKPTQYPQEVTVIGDENVTVMVVNSENRNSVDTFIPIVDYLWIMESTAAGIEITSQSRHCNRFDTFSNDLSDTRREHRGFTVFCDSDESIEIAVLRAPDSYGLENSGDYFLISIKDVQQVNFEALKSYLQSYNS